MEARRTALTQLLSRFFDNSPRELVLDLLGHERTDAEELRQRPRAASRRHPPPGACDRPKTGSGDDDCLSPGCGRALALARLTALLLRAMPRVNARRRATSTWWAALVAVLGIPPVLAAGALRDGFPAAAARRRMRAGAALVLPAVPDWVGCLCASAWAVAALAGLVRVARSCHAHADAAGTDVERRSTRRAKHGCRCGRHAERVRRRRADAPDVERISPAPARSDSVAR